MADLIREVNQFDDISYSDSSDQYVMFFPCMSNKYVEVGDGEVIAVLDSTFAIAMAKQILQHYSVITTTE